METIEIYNGRQAHDYDDVGYNDSDEEDLSMVGYGRPTQNIEYFKCKDCNILYKILNFCGRDYDGDFDDSQGEFYNCNKCKLLLNRENDDFKEINNENILIGEDREFNGNDLFIDLIPKSCWFSNVRTSVVKKDWDRLRKHIYDRVNNKCEICK